MDREEIKLLERVFGDGYRKAEDKLGFMRLSGIPMEMALDGRPACKLVMVKVSDTFTVGSAGPGFGSRDLVYHPFPGEMVTSETALEFIFVHGDGTETYTLAQLLAIRDRRDRP
ncbi:MAG TPA: hypothetical protein ENI55_04935 [Alphaproteobacteria bacterium]|nr:hypothetical protein [Alphaproteobacteria bacterium]